jgi:hypothetical protein
MPNHPNDPEKSKLYNALIDAINRSSAFDKIPLPAIIDNQLEELIKKYKYDQLPEEQKPKFEDDKKEDDKPEFESILVDKKINNKVKQLKKRIDKIPPKTIIQ